jgi:peptidoglycan/xylan/chitin deacetylase (PgdA/CDA1 family)
VTDEEYLWPKNPSKPTKAIKVQCTVAGTVSSSYRLDWTVAVTPRSTHNLSLLMRGDNLGGGSQTGTVRLGETSAFSKYYEWNTPFSTSAGYESRWFPRALSIALPFTTFGTPDPNVSHVRFRVILGASAGTTPTYYINAVRKNTIAQPQIAFVLDDVPTTDYTTAFPYIRDRGLVGSCAVDQAGTNMTVPQMQEIQAAGWSMHNHTATHANLSLLTAPQIRAELEACQSFLRGNNLDSGPSVFIVPFGARNATVDATVLEYYPYSVVSAGETVGTPIWPGIPTPSQIDRVSMDNPVTGSTVIGYINSAVARGNSMIIYGHNVTPSAIAGNLDLDVTFKPVVDHLYRLNQVGAVGNPNLERYFAGLSGSVRRPR